MKYFISMIFFVATCNILKGQDVTFSNFNFNQAYYNPAYTGYYEGSLHLALTTRTLWPNVPGKVLPGPLSTNAAYADTYLFVRKRQSPYSAGLGVTVVSDLQGEGYLKTNVIGLNYAQHLLLTKERNDEVKLSAGFNFYLSSITIDWNKLLFSDQLTLDNGFLPVSAYGQSGIGHALTQDLDAGLLLQWRRLRNFTDFIMHNEFGFALAHIFSPSVSLTGVKSAASKVPRKYVLSYTGEGKCPGDHIYLVPTVLAEIQNKFYELNTSLMIYYKFKADDGIPIGLSVGHRLSDGTGISGTSTNALVFGVVHKGVIKTTNNHIIYYMGAFADAPYGGLGFQTRGAYEISLGLVFPYPGHDNFSVCPMEGFDHSAQIKPWNKYN